MKAIALRTAKFFIPTFVIFSQQLFAATIELNTKSLDEAWEARDKLGQDICNFCKQQNPLPDDYEILWRVSRLTYYCGVFVWDDKTPKNDKLALYDYGLKAGEKARALAPNKVEGHYWYASNVGLYGLTKGILATLSAAKKAKESLDKAINIDPKYHFGGPLRVRGYYYLRLPGGLISFGDKDKAKADLEAALKIGPEAKINYLYMGEYWESQENWEKANEILEKAKNATGMGIVEDKLYQKWIDEHIQKNKEKMKK